jgi:hypothetical protein
MAFTVTTFTSLKINTYSLWTFPVLAFQKSEKCKKYGKSYLFDIKYWTAIAALIFMNITTANRQYVGS